jgi:hypothetical protein
MLADLTTGVIGEETVDTKRQRLVEASVALEEAETRFDAVCQTYFGRELHDHVRIRQRIMGMLLDAAYLPWSWSLVVAHCGVSGAFLERVLDGFLDESET